MQNWNLRHRLWRDAQTLESYDSQVKQIALNLAFEYHGAVTYRKHKELHFQPSDKAFFKIDCINPEGIHCDLDLGQEIMSMVHKKKTELTGAKDCQGWQDYERIGRHRCLCKMNYLIKIEYQS